MQTGKTGLGVLPLPCRIAQEEFDSARTMDMATEVWWVPVVFFPVTSGRSTGHRVLIMFPFPATLMASTNQLCTEMAACLRFTGFSTLVEFDPGLFASSPAQRMNSNVKHTPAHPKCQAHTPAVSAFKSTPVAQILRTHARGQPLA